MNKKLPTRGQLERELSQKIYKLYHQKLKHYPQKITCMIFSNRLVVIVEGALTTVEKTLINEDNGKKLAKSLNLVIGETIEEDLKALVEEILAIEVEDVLMDSDLETERTGAIVTLTRSPVVRDRKSKIKHDRNTERSDLKIEQDRHDKGPSLE